MTIFLTVFYFVQDWQPHFNFFHNTRLTQTLPGSPFQAKILAANQAQFQFLSAKVCHFIVMKDHSWRVSHSLTRFCLDTMPLRHFGSNVTFRCNNEVIQMKSFIGKNYESQKTLQHVGQWFLASIMPNVHEQ